MAQVKTDDHPVRYSICVSGAASGATVQRGAEMATQLGKAIAEAGHVLTTGATIGLPYYSAIGAKQAGGMSIGFSPASSLREHLRKYRLPRDAFDFINFTGMDYVGRDLYLIQSSDAVITIGGRFGSLHEFTSALEAHKPCGVLLGSGGTADQIPALLQALDPSFADQVTFDDDPVRLVRKVVAILDVKFADIAKQVERGQNDWYLQDPMTKRAG